MVSETFAKGSAAACGPGMCGTFVFLFERDKIFYDLKSSLLTEEALLASPGHRQLETSLNSSRVIFCGHSVYICATLWFRSSEDILSSLLA